MSLYQDYIQEIEERKGMGLHPKPIDGSDLLSEIIAQIKTKTTRTEKIHFTFLYTIPFQELLALLASKRSF